jgi:glyoxylase-like metal-dependent hydrolase (beta-lactamase superfamily II)
LTNGNVAEVRDGILRITFALPLGIDHVHCYVLRREDGSWLVVDTGLGVADARQRWASVLAEHRLRVARIVVTHFHPDHVGAAAPLAELTRAPVCQGAVDYAQCVRAWGTERSPERLVSYMREHGLPPEQAEQLRVDGDRLVKLVQYVRDPEPLAPGDDVDGWEILHLPGHADGHLALLRDGVLIAGDTLLATITPNVGLYPEARPDPLGDYLESLSRIVELAPRIAYAGHGETIADPPQRSQELIAHHRERLERTHTALAEEPRTAYEVSLELFPEPLPHVLRRFALAESRAHLEYLVLRNEAIRVGGDGRVCYRR